MLNINNNSKVVILKMFLSYSAMISLTQSMTSTKIIFILLGNHPYQISIAIRRASSQPEHNSIKSKNFFVHQSHISTFLSIESDLNQEMRQHQLIAALVLLGATLAVSLPANSPPIKDDFSIKFAESIDTEDDNSSSTLPTATTPMPSNDSESSINVVESDQNNGSVRVSTSESEVRLDNPNYFEGDLVISQEMIDAFYGKLNATNVSYIIITFFIVLL